MQTESAARQAVAPARAGNRGGSGRTVGEQPLPSLETSARLHRSVLPDFKGQLARNLARLHVPERMTP